jgi:hypothetical protein
MFLVASASQLAMEGLAGYVDSYLEARSKLLLTTRMDITVLPAPFLLAEDCSNTSLLRSMIEFQSWVKISGVDPDGVLNDAMGGSLSITY